MQRETVAVTFPTTAPTGANTQNLFDSTVSMPGFLRSGGASRVTVTIQNDQAGTLKAYWSADGGTTWNQYDTQSVAIPGANLSSGPFDYLVEPFRDFKVDWVNGGVNQTTWRGSITITVGDRAAGT